MISVMAEDMKSTIMGMYTWVHLTQAKLMVKENTLGIII